VKKTVIFFLVVVASVQAFCVDLTLEFDKKMFSMGMVMDAIPIELGFLIGESNGVTMGLKGTEYLEEKIGFLKLSYGKLDYLLKVGFGESLYYRLDLNAEMTTPPVFYDIQASFKNEKDIKLPVIMGDALIFGAGKKMRGFSRLFLDLNTQNETFNLKLDSSLSGNSMSFFPGFFFISNNKITGSGLMFNPIPVDKYGMKGLALKVGTDFNGSPYIGFCWMFKLPLGKSNLEFNTEVGMTEDVSMVGLTFGFDSENLKVKLALNNEDIGLNISTNLSF